VIYREWTFTDITLTPAEERRTRKKFQEMVDKGGTGEMFDRLRLNPPSKYEKQLSSAYHEAETPEDRIAVLEYWMLGLYRAFAEMTRFEQKNFGYRLKALRQLAQALIDRDLRAIELRHHEQRVAAQTAPATKINIRTITGEIVRIHEAMREAGIYAEGTEVGRIVAMYHVETVLKDVESSYRTARDKAEVHSTPSKKLLKVLEVLSDQLSPTAREKLANHCAAPLKKKGT
jgi:hypothetical protein